MRCNFLQYNRLMKAIPSDWILAIRIAGTNNCYNIDSHGLLIERVQYNFNVEYAVTKDIYMP